MHTKRHQLLAYMRFISEYLSFDYIHKAMTSCNVYWDMIPIEERDCVLLRFMRNNVRIDKELQLGHTQDLAKFVSECIANNFS